jgi:MYXO-CTERM domain-containing protein
MTWKLLTLSASPPVRSGHALAYDGARGRLLVFGGSGASGFLGDTWTLSSSRAPGSDCTSSEECSTGACVEGVCAGELDAGVGDAGRPDAGALDAGALDAGRDAPAFDAGGRDGGVRDAAVDGGTAPPAAGCACRALGAAAPSGTPAWWFGVVVLGALARRRRNGSGRRPGDMPAACGRGAHVHSPP